MYKKQILLTLFVLILSLQSDAQTIRFEGKDFEIANVKASIVDFDGAKVLKVERDMAKIPFDPNRLESTVDEPTFVKLKDFSMDDGSIEVKVYSQIQDPSPFEFAQGFIGLAFRIAEDNDAFESIYLRPKVGRSDSQEHRNKTVQYYSYPNYKFERLRKEHPSRYETAAPVALKEWIALRIEINGGKAEMYINGEKYSTIVVSKLLGSHKNGSVGLWVDIGTIGYFKELKITKN